MNKKDNNENDLVNSLSNLKINQGTGAGGSNTNKNGLKHEKINDLSTEYQIIESKKLFNSIKFSNHENIYITGKKSNFLINLGKDKVFKKELTPDGCKEPDDYFID